MQSHKIRERNAPRRSRERSHQPQAPAAFATCRAHSRRRIPSPAWPRDLRVPTALLSRAILATARDLACHKLVAAPRTFMVEKNAGAGEQNIGLAIVYRDPVRVQFCDPIRIAWIERRRFVLRRHRCCRTFHCSKPDKSDRRIGRESLPESALRPVRCIRP